MKLWRRSEHTTPNMLPWHCLGLFGMLEWKNRLGGLWAVNYFSQFQRLLSPRLRVRQIWCLVKAFIPDRCLSTMSSRGGRGSHGGGAKAAFLSPSHKGINPIHKGHPSWPNDPPSPHLLIPSHWGVRFQHMNLRGHEHADHSRHIDYFEVRTTEKQQIQKGLSALLLST